MPQRSEVPPTFRRFDFFPCVFAAALLSLCLNTAALAQADAPRPFTAAVKIDGVTRYGRQPTYMDAVAARLVTGSMPAPVGGETITLADGTIRTWEPIASDAEGVFTGPGLRGAYLFSTVKADRAQVMILEASGHGMVYVNGEPRVGDPYATGSVRVPVAMKVGENQFLFHVSRGPLRAKLVEPTGPLILSNADMTLGDFIIGEPNAVWCAAVVLNATDKTQQIILRAGDIAAEGAPGPVTIPPLSIRKIPFLVPAPQNPEPGTTDVPLKALAIESGQPKPFTETTIKLRVRQPSQSAKRTFISAIDGSVQYYAYVPPFVEVDNAVKPRSNEAPAAIAPGAGIVLSLHGASVEATSQADSYAAKPGLHIVCPTNRRPFGFDWEDWGRLDALEVLDLVTRQFNTDPLRTYVTGHSMGGHGTWHLAVNHPARFAGAAPSAGWVSFWTYGGGELPSKPDALESLLLRATLPSDTLALDENLSTLGVYILHGDADDNVPVDQARMMRKRLAEFHPDFSYFEQRGAGHWWDGPRGPGADCLDWPEIFAMFDRRTLAPPGDTARVRFITASPAIDTGYRMAAVMAQQQRFTPSTVDLTIDRKERKVRGVTANVASLLLKLDHFDPVGSINIEIDKQTILVDAFPECCGKLAFLRRDNIWTLVPSAQLDLQSAHRLGPFKLAFTNRFLLVYSTSGTAAENAWSFAKARYDAETFWYRGNGSVDVIADRDFDPTAPAFLDRNVILYGHAEMNAAWPALLADSPIQVKRSQVIVGDRTLRGDDMGVLFLRPRPRMNNAVVGVIAGSGLAGMRVTDRLPIFVSGAAFPDLLVVGREMLEQPGLGDGVRAVGFFAPDWSINAGEFVWRE